LCFNGEAFLDVNHGSVLDNDQPHILMTMTDENSAALIDEELS